MIGGNKKENVKHQMRIAALDLFNKILVFVDVYLCIYSDTERLFYI